MTRKATMELETLEPIQRGFTEAWQYGLEHAQQEGSSVWQKMREERGLSREDVEQLSNYLVPPPVQQLYEDYPGFPDMDTLFELANVYGMAPGALLDHVLSATGQPMFNERDD